jgi:hypothetical protein
MNITNYSDTTSDDIYNSFNNFIFSNDIKVFGKLLFRHHFYKLTEHMPGDIVEIGIFKGSGILSWLKILKVFAAQTNKKIIGFDFFSADDAIKYTEHVNQGSSLQSVIRRVNENELSLETVNAKINSAGFDKSKYILVKGDVKYTIPEFVNKNPGFRISILYLDADIAEPTYYSLLYLWDLILPGGYIIFDEYEFHTFNECAGVEQFLKEKNLEYSIQTTNFYNPTAFMIKKHF